MNILRKTALVGICWWGCVMALSAQSNQEKITELIEANVKSPEPFSGSVLVAYKGKVVYRGAFGKASLTTGVKNTLNSKYFIASITKQLTTVAFLQLVEQKKLKLTDKLSRWLPQIKDADKITLHHLLCHQSGLRRDSHQGYDAQVTPLERVLSVKNDTLLFAPGTRERYSSVGFYALTHVLEKVSGLKYDQYFKQYIFRPCKMRNTGIRMRKNQAIANLSVGMHMQPDKYGVADLGHANYFDSYSLGGGGSIYSTVEDMYRYFVALKSGKLLSAKSLKLMEVKWEAKKQRSPYFYYSYGWEMYNHKELGKILTFTGRINGYKSMLRYYKESDVLLIMLCNTDYSDRGRLGGNIRRILMGQKYSLPKIPANQPITKAMRKHEGVYDYKAEKTKVKIKIVNGKMTITSHGDDPIYLYAENENTFYSNLLPLVIKFTPTTKNKTQELHWSYRRSMNATIPRVKD